MTALTAAVTFVDSETGRNYTVRLVKEGATVDDWSKRYLAAPVGWRDGRLAFMFSDVEGNPHEEARLVGNLFNLRHETIDGDQWVVADLDWDSDELATEAKRLVDEDRLTGVSIAPSDGEGFMVCGSPPDGSTLEDIRAMSEQFDPETCPGEDWIEAWGGVIIGSATLLVNPAFEDAQVVVAGGLVFEAGTQVETEVVSSEVLLLDVGDFAVKKTIVLSPSGGDDTEQMQRAIDAITAADLKRPPADWFTDPHLKEPTPLTITEDGQVFGHLALWDTCHRGFDNTCITPPERPHRICRVPRQRPGHARLRRTPRSRMFDRRRFPCRRAGLRRIGETALRPFGDYCRFH